MSYMGTIEICKLACKTSNKYGLFISFDNEVNSHEDWLELQAASGGTLEATGQSILDGLGLKLFESKAEVDEAYNHIVGDDGPTPANPYDGPARIYALTIGPNGEALNENT